MNKILFDPNMKRTSFKKFLLTRNPSEKFASQYLSYLNGSLVRSKTKSITGKDSIYEVESIPNLHEIYHVVKNDVSNIRLHNIYSGAISAYIKFLVGNELRKMVNKKSKE